MTINLLLPMCYGVPSGANRLSPFIYKGCKVTWTTFCLSVFVPNDRFQPRRAFRGIGCKPVVRQLFCLVDSYNIRSATSTFSSERTFSIWFAIIAEAEPANKIPLQCCPV